MGGLNRVCRKRCSMETSICCRSRARRSSIPLATGLLSPSEGRFVSDRVESRRRLGMVDMAEEEDVDSEVYDNRKGWNTSTRSSQYN